MPISRKKKDLKGNKKAGANKKASVKKPKKDFDWKAATVNFNRSVEGAELDAMDDAFF